MIEILITAISAVLLVYVSFICGAWYMGNVLIHRIVDDAIEDRRDAYENEMLTDELECWRSTGMSPAQLEEFEKNAEGEYNANN